VLVENLRTSYSARTSRDWLDSLALWRFDSGGRTFLQRGSPTPTSLASVARIIFCAPYPSQNGWKWL